MLFLGLAIASVTVAIVAAVLSLHTDTPIDDYSIPSNSGICEDDARRRKSEREMEMKRKMNRKGAAPIAHLPTCSYASDKSDEDEEHDCESKEEIEGMINNIQNKQNNKMASHNRLKKR